MVSQLQTPGNSISFLTICVQGNQQSGLGGNPPGGDDKDAKDKKVRYCSKYVLLDRTDDSE